MKKREIESKRGTKAHEKEEPEREKMNKNDLPEIHLGLDGVYVATTSISKVDGENGQLSYRGKSVEEVTKMSFAQAVYWVLKARLPSKKEEDAFEGFLLEHLFLSDHEMKLLKTINPHLHPMKVLQGLIPLFDCQAEGKLEGFLPEEEVGLIMTAKISAIICCFHQLTLGEEMKKPKEGLNFHENFLYRFNSRLPTSQESKVLDVVQILQMEHGFNASTFSAIVTASTLAPVEVALSAAVGTLFGKLHGGADQAALEMAMEIGDVESVEKFVFNCLSKKEKIMGMGHRMYKTVDPRAKILKPLAEELSRSTPFETNFRVLEKLEQVMNQEMAKKGKDIWANVEFYKGLVFQTLGVPSRFFTALFAMARSVGYVAHIVEYTRDNRLVRPKAYYIGK